MKRVGLLLLATAVLGIRRTGGWSRIFTRVETFGNPDVHWVRVTVDPRTPGVFSFDQQLVR